MTYRVEASPADVALAGGETACGISDLNTAANQSSIESIRSSGVTATRLFWFRGADQAVYRHTRTGAIRAQYYAGKTANSAEHIRSHHAVILSTLTPPPNISGILTLYDNIVKSKGKEFMGNKNGRLWLQVETATKQFEENGA
jgi:hypothetical protein